MRHFDGSCTHRISSLQTGHDFTGSECLDRKVTVSCFGNMLGNVLGTSVNRIKRFWKR
ncbi:hypothetical protein D3C72_2551640 [compost metagenome]